MTWIEFGEFVAVAVVLLFLPGILVGRCARMSWITSIGLAPAISTTSIAGAAILADRFGFRWGLLPLVLLVILLAGGCFVASMIGVKVSSHRTRMTGTGKSETANTSVGTRVGWSVVRPRVWWCSTAVGAIALMCYHLKVLIVSPEGFSQTFDNAFHLNAIRWIADHGNGSSLTFTMTSGDAPAAFYPLAWHDLASLVLLVLKSSNVPAANNASIFAVGGFAWVIGCLFLARTLIQCSTPGIVSAGFLCTAFPSFPYLPISWGVLYPNFLGLALLPSAVAFTAQVLGLGVRPRPSLWSSLPIGVLAVLGAALAHPNTVGIYLVILLPLLVTWAVLQFRNMRRLHLGRAVFNSLGVCLLAVLITIFVWAYVRPDKSQATWEPTHTVPQALGEALSLAPNSAWVTWFPAAAVVAGSVVVLRTRRNLWMLVAHCLVIWLWIVAAAWPWGSARTALVGIWYNDPYRLAAALPITAFPLAVIACSWLGGLASERLKDVSGHWPVLSYGMLEVLVAVVSVAILLPATQTTKYLRTAIGQGSETYRVTSNANLVDSDEYSLIRRLPELVPEGAVVATTPYNGASMAYALENVNTTTTHIFYNSTSDITVINVLLDHAQELPTVCRALDDLNVRYVLDFGPKEVNNNDWAVNYGGFDNLSTSPGFVEIAREGHAVLYRIDACGS